MQHGSHVAVAVAGSLSSDLTPSLGTSYASGAALERKKKKKESLKWALCPTSKSHGLWCYCYYFTKEKSGA